MRARRRFYHSHAWDDFPLALALLLILVGTGVILQARYVGIARLAGPTQLINSARVDLIENRTFFGQWPGQAQSLATISKNSNEIERAQAAPDGSVDFLLKSDQADIGGKHLIFNVGELSAAGLVFYRWQCGRAAPADGFSFAAFHASDPSDFQLHTVCRPTGSYE